MTNRRQFCQNIAMLSGLSLTGCGWRLADVGAKAAKFTQSDRLYIYTWAQYTDQQLLTTFTTNTGIKVVADVYESNEVMLAKLLAGGGSAYSIIYPSDYMVRKMRSKGLLTEIDHTRLVGLHRLFERFSNPSYDNNNNFSIPFSWGTTGLIYNSKKLTPPPEDWRYLWQNKEKLSKRMTLLNDVREVMGATLRMLGYSYNSQDQEQIKQAYESLVELKDYIANFDTDSWQNQILAGDLLLAMCYSSDAVKIGRENPDMKFVIPSSGSSLWTDTIVIPKDAPNIDGAYEWLDLILEPEVSVQLTTRLSIATPNRLGFEQLPQELQENRNLFPPDAILEKCERITPLGKFEELYERYWTHLKVS
jgi:spermidine/putrescine transport system substrate-binding protein